MFDGSRLGFPYAEGGTYLGTTRAAAPFLLSLPKLAKTIPVQYRQAAHASLQNLVRQFARLGVIKKEDLTADATVSTLLHAVIKRELASTLGSLEVLDIDPLVADGAGDHFYGAAEEELDEESSIYVGLQVATQPQVFVGQRLQELDALAPGLAQTVYHVLDRCGWGSFGLFTIDYAIDGMPWLYQFEEREDENGHIDPNDPNEKEGGMFEGMPTKEALLAGLPDWVMKPQLLLTPDDLDAIASKANTPAWAKATIAATLAAAEAWKDGSYKLCEMAMEDQEPVYQLATIRFTETDQIGRVIDDYMVMANQSSDSHTEMNYLKVVDLSDNKKVDEWWKGFKAGCQLIKSVDTLLQALSTP